MKKLLLFLFSVMMFINSYGEWTKLGTIDGETNYIDFDAINEHGDGYVYWWIMMSNLNESTKYYIQTDCEGGRVNPLQINYHSKSMGGGELTSVTLNEGWTYIAPDIGLYDFLQVVCEFSIQTHKEQKKRIKAFIKIIEANEKEEELANSLIVEDQLNTLRSSYLNNIAARVKIFWRYQEAEDDWSCLVYVLQDENGKVEAVNIQDCNVDDRKKARVFKDSIEQAVYRASPLPSAPDGAVFDKQILFKFCISK
jgi:hypothetical protein